VPLEILGDVRITRPHLVVRARRRLSQVLQRCAPDVVITQSAWSHAIFAPVVRRARLPLVMWLHDVPQGRTWLEKLAAKWPPDLFVCNSAFTERAAHLLFPSVPTELIRCPLALEPVPQNRAEVRRQFATPGDAAVIVNVARMEPYKGHRVLIEALANLQTTTPWRCWIVGGAQRPSEAKYEHSLHRIVEMHGLEDRVMFLGLQRNVGQILAAADFYCHPNQGAEPFGLAIVEALHAGLPVIATRLGGPEEIITDECGTLVPAGDVPALGDALEELIDDETLRRRLASAGPDRARTLCEVSARMNDLRHALERVLLRAAA
jgi:glycosyltransferase involved in cell wall biosynthesis